jgi:two-component system NtrC family sensor kinase
MKRLIQFKKLQTRLSVYFAASTALIITLLYLVVLLISYHQANGEFRKHLCSIAKVAALQINGDVHATLVTPAQETSPVYLQMKQHLQKIRESVEYDVKYVYTWRFNADGRLVFVLDTGITPEEMSHIGDIYENNDPQFLNMISSLDRPMADKDFVPDKWGSWLSAYAPIYTSDGKKEGILGMDVSASSITAFRKRHIIEMTVIFISVLPLAILIGGVIGRRLAKPITELKAAAEHITGGDLDYTIDVHGHDEVGQLALSFRAMTMQLKTSINNLRERAVLRQEVNAIQQSLLKMAPLEEKLNKVTNSIVKVFQAESCRIWLIRPGDRCQQDCIHARVKEGPYVCRDSQKCLHLLASSGSDTLNDKRNYARVPFGCYKMGRLASEQERKILTNDIQNDPNIHDHQWARQLGLTSFAGYQLKVEGSQTFGVMALFSKQSIEDSTDMLLDGISSSVALAVQEALTAQTVNDREEKYRSLFEGSRDAIMTIEPPLWNFTACNQATVELFRAGTKEGFTKLGPKDVSPEFQPDGVASCLKAQEMVKTALREGVSAFEWTHRRANGQEFPATVLLARMHYHGKVVIQATVRDITEQKWAENELIRANKSLEDANASLRGLQSQIIQNEKMAAIGQLAAGVAHEMNNPIGFVASNFETLEGYISKFKNIISMYEEMDKEIQKTAQENLISKCTRVENAWKDLKMDFVLEDIQVLFTESKEGLDRVTKIIQSLRDFSRIDQVTDICEFDLNEGIRDTLIVAKNEIKYDCDIKTDLSEIPAVCCNPGQINQVILNILVNAAQAIKSQNRKEKGHIAIKTFKTDEGVICEITDDGPGIPPEIITKVFEPFFTTKPVGKGTGLGLSISRDIILKHKGQLLVDSTVDKGTTFKIQLPLHFEASEPQEESSENVTTKDFP